MRAIVKKHLHSRQAPNLTDYATASAAFSWDAARAELDGLPGGKGVNIAHEAVDRHAMGAGAGAVALRFLRKDGTTARDVTYGELASLSNRFANALGALGIKRGDRIPTCAPRSAKR